MVRRLLAGIALSAALPLLAIPVAITPAGATPRPAVQQCMNGGWQTQTNASGQPFSNQGQCISFAIHHPVSLADLAGSFSGTTSFTFGTGGCSFVEQVFDATYPGSSAVGSVTLHLDGCVNPGGTFQQPQFTYTGTFTIATTAGTLAGNAAGPINNVPTLPFDFELTLNVLSGTGAFAATTGTIHVSISWPGGPSMTGTVTIP